MSCTNWVKSILNLKKCMFELQIPKLAAYYLPNLTGEPSSCKNNTIVSLPEISQVPRCSEILVLTHEQTFITLTTSKLKAG